MRSNGAIIASAGLSLIALALYAGFRQGQAAFLLLPAVYLLVLLFRNLAFPQFYALVVALIPLSIPISLSFGASLEFPSELLIVFLGVVFLVQLSRTREWRWIRKFPLPLFWILTFAIPTAFSKHPAVSVKFMLINGLYVGVFYYGTLWWKRRGEVIEFPWKPFLAGLIPVFILAGIAFYKYDFNPVTLRGIYEPFYYSHTIFGASVAILAGYFSGRASISRSNSRVVWVFLALTLGMITVLSGSRAALWSYVAALLALGLFQLRPAMRIAVPIGLVILAIAAIGPKKIQSALENNPYLSHNPRASILEKSLSVTNVQTDVSNIERINRWIAALKMGAERWATGFGPGTYQFEYIPYQDEAFMNRLTVVNPERPPDGSGGTAHSEILLQWAENGLFSTIVFAWMILRWLFLGLMSTGTRNLATQAYFLGLLTYFIHMNVNNFLNQPAFAFLFWTFAAFFDAHLNAHSIEPKSYENDVLR